jgi:hypothetical protein
MLGWGNIILYVNAYYKGEIFGYYHSLFIEFQVPVVTFRTCWYLPFDLVQLIRLVKETTR